jgi:hypothetical protein
MIMILTDAEIENPTKETRAYVAILFCPFTK